MTFKPKMKCDYLIFCIENHEYVRSLPEGAEKLTSPHTAYKLFSYVKWNASSFSLCQKMDKAGGTWFSPISTCCRFIFPMLDHQLWPCSLLSVIVLVKLTVFYTVHHNMKDGPGICRQEVNRKQCWGQFHLSSLYIQAPAWHMQMKIWTFIAYCLS